MKAPPPVQVTVARFGRWRAGLAAVSATAAAGACLWLAQRAEVDAAAGVAAAAVVALLAGGSLLGAARPAPFSLRWDRQQWHLGSVDRIGDEPWRGHVSLMIDLGGWLLLRFDADPPGPRRRWLPIERRGLEPAWHGLRCAVYCAPRSPAGPDPAADLARPAE